MDVYWEGAVKPIQWICEECGRKHGNRVPEMATWHHGKCDCCGLSVPVTSGRRFGVWEVEKDGQ